MFSSGTESVSVVTDGSGFVTGLALQQLKHEKSLVVRENDQLKTRMQKIRGELMAEKEKINKERCVCVCAHYYIVALFPPRLSPLRRRSRESLRTRLTVLYILIYNRSPVSFLEVQTCAELFYVMSSPSKILKENGER